MQKKADYKGGIKFTYHIKDNTLSMTSGNRIQGKHYRIYVWVTLKTDPSISSNVVTYTYDKQ